MTLKSVFITMVVAGVIAGGAASAEKTKEAPGSSVDSGTFGVFINGKRVATETFSITQASTGNVITSQFHTDPGVDKAEQSSELHISPTGELREYEWKEISPGQAQATVTPSDTFLMERATKTPQDKVEEQPFLLPSSTSILDDYFFVHREVLAWKYLASTCRPQNGQMQCPVGQKAQFGTLNPHARSSMLVSLEVAGQDKVKVGTAERDLTRLTLKGDTGDWTIWVDEQFKVQKMSVPADNTEIVRD
jgi:hypothetical protein